MDAAYIDYIPTLQQLIQHWTEAETVLGRAMILDDGTTLDGIRDLHETLASANAEVLAKENQRQGAIQARDHARSEALPTGRQARFSILGTIPQSEEARQLPKQLPPLTSVVAKQLVALQDIQEVWTAVNALPAGKYPALHLPLVVRVSLDGTERDVTLAQFQGMVASLGQGGEAVKQAEISLKVAQKGRKEVVLRAQVVLRKYRALIRGLFPTTSKIAQSVP